MQALHFGPKARSRLDEEDEGVRERHANSGEQEGSGQHHGRADSWPTLGQLPMVQLTG